jgi:hypothetical protein
MSRVMSQIGPERTCAPAVAMSAPGVDRVAELASEAAVDPLRT